MLLTNTYDFPILDFGFRNLSGFVFPVFELGANGTNSSSQVVNVTVLRSDVGEHSIESVVSFKYLVNIPEGARTWTVNISSAGFNPVFLVVRSGDTVVWNNKDVISHSVTSATFDATLSPNASFSRSFGSLGVVDYQDVVQFFGGSVQVISASNAERVNNPHFDRSLLVRLLVTLDKTFLEVLNSKGNYSLSTTGSEEGLLTIRNVGNETAQKVHLGSSPSWVGFDENDFDLRSGETNFVTYKVAPQVFRTADTNKSYEVVVSAVGLNAGNVSVVLSVCVPFDSVFDNANSSEEFLARYDAFCRGHPTSLICNNTISSGGGEAQVIIRDPVLGVNLTQTEVLAMLRRYQELKDGQDRTNNQLKDVADRVGTDIPEIKSKLEESIALQLENERVSVVRTRSFWIAIGFMGVMVLIVVLGLSYKRLKEKEHRANGGVRLSWF